MALASTTLSGAKAVNQTYLQIATTTGMTRGKLFRVDDEFFAASSDASGNQVPVLSGQQGRAVATHVSGAIVLWGDPSDFPTAPHGTDMVVPYQPTSSHQTIVTATGGTISVPLNSAGAFVALLGTVTTAQTIPEPVYAQEGQVVTIQAAAAQAYIVQAVTSAGVASDTSFSGDQDIATFGGAIGDCFSFKAVNGAWLVLTKTNVTLTDT